MARNLVNLTEMTPIQRLTLLRLEEAAEKRANLPRAGYGEGPGYLDVRRLAKVADHVVYSLYHDCRDLGLQEAAERIIAALRDKVAGSRS